MDRQRHQLTHAPHPGGEPPSGRHRRAVRGNRAPDFSLSSTLHFSHPFQQTLKWRCSEPAATANQ